MNRADNARLFVYCLIAFFLMSFLILGALTLPVLESDCSRFMLAALLCMRQVGEAESITVICAFRVRWALRNILRCFILFLQAQSGKKEFQLFVLLLKATNL